MPLENLEFKLKSSPLLHQLNEIFQKEIEELKQIAVGKSNVKKENRKAGKK